MSRIIPGAGRFEVYVYGTVFAERAAAVARLHPGSEVILVPDPPGTEDPSVWVHAPGGDVVGHLAPDVTRWLVPWMLAGHRCAATVLTNGGDDVESWKRLVLDVTCRE